MFGKAIFMLTVLKILLSEGRSVLCPAQQGTGSVKVKVLVKNKNCIRNLLKFLEKDSLPSLRGFEWFLDLFGFV